MSGNNQAVEALLKVFEQLQTKRDKLKGDLIEAEKECDAIASALRVLGHTSRDINVKGLTQLGALIAIARANNNEVSVKSARRQMVHQGMFENPGHASSIIHTTISRSGKFKRIKPGVYKLLEKPETSSEEMTDRVVNSVNAIPIFVEK